MTQYDPAARPGQRNDCDRPNVNDFRVRLGEAPVCQMCGLLVRDGEHTEVGWPTSETGLWVRKHEHVWVEVCWDLGANGWSPRYRCEVCTDEIVDLAASPMFRDPDAEPATA